MLTISSTAPESEPSSFIATGEKEIDLSLSSSADSTILTEWSDMRSKSPIICKSFVTSWLSAASISRSESFTR